MIYKIPHSSSLQDAQFVSVAGPDGLFSGFQFDLETKSMYIKDAQVLYPSFHGATHISEDPVPDATIDLPGLMSADDKAKLESMIQTKIGILGFQGAGFPDDGGWLEGPIIFASGSELFSIERMGNVVRFSVDTPIPLTCNCEECAQIYWIQDETEVNAIRPPSCAGRLPGIDVYNELKVYLFPESTIIDPNNPANILNNKDQYPAMIFKRYENNNTYSGQIELVLRRNENLTSNVGWSMTPGAEGTTLASTIWYTGTDTDGRTIEFRLDPSDDPNMLGALLYQGHNLTRRMGIITNYDTTVATTNMYKVKYWDVPNATIVGDEFDATNIWKYENASSTPTLVPDATTKLLDIGKLVQLWEFNITNTNLVRRYFCDEPRLAAEVIWTHTAAISFGDTLTARVETDDPEAGGNVDVVTDLRVFENSNWGIVGFPDPLYAVPIATGDLDGPYNYAFRANIDYDLPGLSIENDSTEDVPYERPVYIWNRSNHSNFYSKMYIGQPDTSDYPPIDILFRSPVDSFDDIYVIVRSIGTIGTNNFVVIDGANINDLPKRGTIRFLSKNENLIWRYDTKALTDGPSGTVMLIGSESIPETTEGTVEPTADEMSLAVILHDDYNTYCCRLEFAVDNTSGSESVQLQFRVGILDMEEEYEFDKVGETDNLVKGFMPNSYAVSRWFTQDGFWTGPGTTEGDPVNFIVYPGGTVSGQESWNKLELMCRDNQLWIWWNELLVAPDASSNLGLVPPPTIDVSNPYFSIAGNPGSGIPAAPSIGQFGLRLWPGAKLRNVTIRDQAIRFNEMQYGQLEIIT